MGKMNNREEQILINITGQDRPGLTASIMEILAHHDAQILECSFVSTINSRAM